LGGSNIIPIENRITGWCHLLEALQAMREYRNWSESTYKSYENDISLFEGYMSQAGWEPQLGNVKLHIVNKWLKEQQTNHVAASTIRRRAAALSSLFAFYLNLGVITTNPFKASEKPVGESSYDSALLEIKELKEIVAIVKHMKQYGVDIELTVRMMIFSGLRNEALTMLRVKDILLDQSLIRYHAGYINSKHKIQFIPIPKKLLGLIKDHIRIHNLQPEDQLLYGLSGVPLHSKQLNRITNRLNKELGWEGEHRVTPHGFRSSLATLLSERGVDIKAIKLVLGHSDKDLEFHDNVWIYIRKHKRFIQMLQKELDAIEEELETVTSAAESINSMQTVNSDQMQPVEHGMICNEELILSLLDSHPKIALEMIKRGFMAPMVNTKAAQR
jgi:site-specific recombinase XerD